MGCKSSTPSSSDPPTKAAPSASSKPPVAKKPSTVNTAPSSKEPIAAAKPKRTESSKPSRTTSSSSKIPEDGELVLSDSITSSIKSGSSRMEGAVFGKGVHVGRAGNVDFSGRNMDSLTADMINSLSEDNMHRTATSLTLSDNRLYSLGREVAVLSKVEEVELDRNKFQRLPEVLTQLLCLKRISVNNNPINGDWGLDVLTRVSGLRVLSVQDCGFKQVPPGVLALTTTLTELDLSNNPDIKLHEANFGLMKLKKLRIANCGLNGVGLPGGVKVLSTLTLLDISNNSFDFDANNDNFFGKHIPTTLKELHIRGMQLTSVPPAIVKLVKLSTLDISENPIETLDVLAGRLVRRISRISSGSGIDDTSGDANSAKPKRASIPVAASANNTPGNAKNAKPTEKEDDVVSNSDRVSTSSKVSMSKLSKAGRIASVAQPIPLKRLYMRACELRTVPKYFHKMTNLEELDISDNINLDDPNMTLFSLQNLKKLNVTGCPFAESPSKARNEWFDIAKLNYLKDLKWEQWKANHNMSSYRTRIPIEICGMRLERINEIELRNDLYTGDTVKTIVNLLRDGYFKVDLSVDDDTVYSHGEAVQVFDKAEPFFFPKDSQKTHQSDPKRGKTEPVVYGKDLGAIHLRIAVCRYIFFLAVQAANYDAVIIPPLDVMVVHYSQATCCPGKYRADCEAVCGRVLNCNYRNFFIEQKRHAAAAKDAIAASKNIWNLMVRSAQRELEWLRYDFWERQLRGASNVKEVSTQDTHAVSPLPICALGGTNEDIFTNVNKLRGIDAGHDLSTVLDPSISSYFEEQGEGAFSLGLQSFFSTNRLFIKHMDVLQSLQLDWTRYIKYLALYAYRVEAHRSDQSLVLEPTADAEGNLYAPRGPVPHQTSILGPHYDLMNNVSFADPDKYLPQPASEKPSGLNKEKNSRDSNLTRRTASALSRAPAANRNTEEQRQAALMGMTVNPIPTIGLTLLLHTHRTAHVKYYQTLTLLGIEDIDVFWVNNPDVVRETKKAWSLLFNEEYVNSNQQFNCGTDMDQPLLPRANTSTQYTFGYNSAEKPKASALKRVTSTNSSRKQVTMCGGDAEYGVF